MCLQVGIMERAIKLEDKKTVKMIWQRVMGGFAEKGWEGKTLEVAIQAMVDKTGRGLLDQITPLQLYLIIGSA